MTDIGGCGLARGRIEKKFNQNNKEKTNE